MASSFGDLLYELIKAEGMTIREFGRRIGTPHATLSHIRHGRRKPSYKKLHRYAEVLNLKPGSHSHQSFMDHAAVAMLPKEFQPRFQRLIDQK